MLGLIPPRPPGETNLNSLTEFLCVPLQSACCIMRAFAAADFDCF
jgi:hypothetical protein